MLNRIQGEYNQRLAGRGKHCVRTPLRFSSRAGLPLQHVAEAMVRSNAGSAVPMVQARPVRRWRGWHCWPSPHPRGNQDHGFCLPPAGWPDRSRSRIDGAGWPKHLHLQRFQGSIGPLDGSPETNATAAAGRVDCRLQNTQESGRNVAISLRRCSCLLALQKVGNVVCDHDARSCRRRL